MLHIYDENGFKLIHCNPDKTPKKSWRDPVNHLSLETAESLQNTGEMIGAIIPNDIIVIDLDRHEGKPDGVKTFQEIKNKYNIKIDLSSSTLCVQTAGGGYHIFLYTGIDHGFTQGEKAPGVDLKTDAGYVIAAGSPGYSVLSTVVDMDITEIPETLKIWLESVNKKAPPPPQKKETNKSNIPVDLLKKILKKLDVKEFNTNDKWYDLIVSAIAAAGDSDEIIDILVDWSAGDSAYSDVRDRIKLFEKDGGITTGTFIHILKENGISQYFIKKIMSFETSIELYDNMRDDGNPLPFPEPDYDSISDSKEARELFITGGNSVAATLLGFAIHNHIIWCEADKGFYLFDGNRWDEFYDMFSVCYTVLIRLTKFMYAKKKATDIDNENFIKLVKVINKTHWKRETINELQCREGVFHKNAKWDSEKLKETLTALDGVIDFTNDNIIIRKGEREEFRKSFVEYKCDEIIKASEPKKYNFFLKGLFPDKDTLFTARQASSMYISGNAKKGFQVFHGGGDNGKSTWIEIIKELLGEKAHTYSTSIITANKYGDDKLPPEAAEFMGKYVLFGSEVEKGKNLSLGKLKNFTGDDTIGVRPLYKNLRTFRPTWQMILSVNDLPFFDGTDRAFINRLIIMPFERTFVDSEEVKTNLVENGFNPDLVMLKIDPNKLKAEIKKEFPAIINQMINDYVILKIEYNGIILQSLKCRQHKQSYVNDNNDFENFINEMCVLSISEDCFVTSEAITEAYQEYVGNHKLSSSFVTRCIIKSRQEVTRETKIIIETYADQVNKGETVDKKVQKRGLSNIRLKTITELEQDIEKHNQDILEENLNKKYDDDINF